MISLTYLSRAAEPLDQSQLEGLLNVSRDRNRLRGVTGMLLYVDHQFIQTLEGEPPDVEETMERILADPRHRDVDVTLVEEVEERAFDGWTMGFKILNREAVAQLPGFSDFLEDGSDPQAGSASLRRAGKFHRTFRDVLPHDR